MKHVGNASTKVAIPVSFVKFMIRMEEDALRARPTDAQGDIICPHREPHNYTRQILPLPPDVGGPVLAGVRDFEQGQKQSPVV